MLRSLARLVRAAPPLPAETVLRRTPTVARLARPFGSLPGLRPIAINDLGADCPYSAEEQAVRCKLASLYRLVDARGWSMGIYNHITARITASDEHFLVNPFGLLYDEVTASNLVRVDLAGAVLDPGSSAAGVNLAGYVLHSAIHETRPDVMCALHVHLPDAIAVSTMQCGLLPITQEALVVHGFAGVSYHDYQGILINSAEKKDIQENLGPKNKVLVLRNHGVVVCGETVEEAYLLLDFFMIACQSQVAMMAAGVDGLAQISSVAFENMLKMKEEAKGVDTKTISEGKALQFGQQDFEACMRKLDRAGLSTGYPYRRPELLDRQ
ncbi:alpha-adducin-like [Amphibalanus amphitrite]|uniref:alpha-adducin-like n=1 Tax=Amphibalanus amphitrite TaxID=1232801 RepID=UPI001C9080BF|nr:alpha-adducin-like [Amphibalanus amphitrite]XP_043232665.1 alpha-adducin-like [Amphibalanus amphitrite]XP_043232666.1 alpha-adducin-like [Amphibalanus amphitrite]XP_043232667.1 alpha-adducin-like [Amphibalanus amphitrite]XP_043232668.1 alpha-adducin-like [Amphibalanus amphitrite]XP_043232669.1 alpha-adducin-like [Amphibalanus amphitrite]XP_043232671.1 alpha-adducin-like [Amphibalanus amphitrite]